MTRLLFVHGIAQEGKSSKELETEWTGALDKGLKKIGKKGIKSVASAPFYGDRLAALTNLSLTSALSSDQRNRGLHPDQIKRGPPKRFSVEPDFSRFAMEFAADAVTEKPNVAASALALG